MMHRLRTLPAVLASALLSSAVLLPWQSPAQTAARPPEQVELPDGMTAAAVIRLDRLQHSAPPAARETMLSASGLSVWLLKRCGLTPNDAVSITVGTAGSGAQRLPFHLISARQEIVLADSAAATGGKVGEERQLGNWPAVQITQPDGKASLLARVSTRSLVTMPLPPADEPLLRSIVENIAAASRVREAVAAETACIAFFRCADPAELTALFPATLPMPALFAGTNKAVARLIASDEHWTLSASTGLPDVPAATASEARWDRWAGIALPDSNADASASGSNCNVSVEVALTDLTGLLAPLPPESAPESGTASEPEPATEPVPPGTAGAAAMAANKSDPAAPAAPAIPDKPEPAHEKSAEPLAEDGPAPDSPKLTGEDEIAARRRAQNLASSFNGAVAAGGIEQRNVNSLADALKVLRAGVHGTGRHGGMLYQVTTTEAEARDASRYLRLSGGVLRYLPPGQ